jgi:Ca2+-binding EF-hand superfamily protein
MLIDKLKGELRLRGALGFIGLQRKFRIMDDDNNKCLDLAEFKKAMKEMNLSLTDSELRLLFEHFDCDHSNDIDFEEFIQGVRDPLTERRLKLVQMAFDKLDKDGNGIVDGTELAQTYDASRHPEVIAGRMTEKEVLTQFLETFDVGGVKDGMVTQQEFINYYTNLGANIDNEDYFELMIRNAWHISGGEGWSANSANRRVLVTHEDGRESVEEIKNDLGLKAGDKEGMMSRLRNQGVKASGISSYGTYKEEQPASRSLPAKALRGTGNSSALASSILNPSSSADTSSFQPGGMKLKPSSRNSLPPSYGVQVLIDKLKVEIRSRGGLGYLSLQRKFRIIDDDNDKMLSLGEFKKAMKEMNMNLSDSELRLLFDYFDIDGNSNIDFEEFIQGIRDPLTERRLRLVQLAFNKLDKDGNGIVDAAEIAQSYDASRHPDVLNGRKTAHEVLNQFLETFDVGGVKDGMVTQQEFINYYTNLGANIDNEDYFELMIRNAWHISGGEGWSANSANRRVLVTHEDGRESVEEIKNDLGLKAGDVPGMVAKLRAQNTNVSQLNLYGGDEYRLKPARRPGTAPAAYSNPITQQDDVPLKALANVSHFEIGQKTKPNQANKVCLILLAPGSFAYSFHFIVFLVLRCSFLSFR